jgi:N utilization substance protein B
LERISAIDRAILRLAMHEMRATDTPAKVVINEAINLAKKFSSEDARGFVNGILDTYRKTINVD